MAKRKKTIWAGRLVLTALSSMPLPRDPDSVRAEKSKCMTAARQRMNLKHSCQKLELLLAGNFDSSGRFLTLTYDDAHLPADRRAASRRLRTYLGHLRDWCKARGKPLRYIYVTEGAHGDKRLHHHLVLSGVEDCDVIHSLWANGYVESKPLDPSQFADLARYLTKEPRDGIPQNGKRCWTPSLNLTRPETSSEIVDDDMTLVPPPGAVVLESDQMRNEFGEFVYLKYLLPEPPVRPFGRPKRKRRRT